MAEKNRVLIVDDEAVDRKALINILKADYDILEAGDGLTALDILEDETKEESVGIAAVMLDLVMPILDGSSFMKMYQKIEKYRGIPVIVVASDGDVATERGCLELGAWDFVRKPFDPLVIRFRVKNVIERSQQELNRKLRYRAQYDLLTGIYNKSHFFDETRVLLDRHPNEDFVFIRLDIEKFQLVNSFYGVAEGDGLLCYIASELKSFAGGSKRVSYGRIDADVFGICMPYCGDEDIASFAQYVRTRFAQYNREFDIVPTVGVYVVEDRTLTLNDMYDKANLAAKHCKGNYIRNYAFYTTEMSDELMNEQRIVNRMKYALENNEFMLYLQPKYNLQTNRVSGAEVLVRWKNGTQGMIPPNEFIPVFERNGFIVKLDYYVWEKTCQMIAKWIKEGRKISPISVNISRVSLYNPRLVETISGLVEKYQIPRHLLQLEVTESAYVGSKLSIHEMVESFQLEGFSILMDDFGSGYSSLNALKDISVDILKIDMKFLSDTDKQGRSRNILASVVRMAKWLDMPVVAEGVERREQVEFLRSIGCEYVQGYYFAKPMPMENYEELAVGEENAAAVEQARLKVDANELWTSSSEVELLFSGMLQAVAVYEYEEKTGNLDVIRVNNAYYEMFGYEDISKTGKQILESMEEEGRRVLDKALRALMDSKALAECEYLRRLPGGKWIWIQLKLKYIEQVGEKHIIFGSLIDITEQKELDSELQKYRRASQMQENGVKTVLIVDDVEVNRISLRCIFEKDYQVLEAENGKQALEILEAHSNNVDIILLDLTMPVMDGTTFLAHKRANHDIAGIPVIIITADDTSVRQTQTLELGADDYIIKPFVPKIALRRVKNVLDARQQFKGRLKGYRKEVEALSGEEQLGWYNRRTEGGVQNVGAVALVAVHNTEEIADRYSYRIAGDIIRVLGERLKRYFEGSDIMARYDRKEFVVYMGSTIDHAALEQKCRTLFEELDSILEKGIQVECSVGAALAGGDDESLFRTMERADLALYQATQKGINQFVVL